MISEGLIDNHPGHFMFGAFMTAQKRVNGDTVISTGAQTIVARNKAEAVGHALEAARRDLPPSEGYHSHQADVHHFNEAQMEYASKLVRESSNEHTE